MAQGERIRDQRGQILSALREARKEMRNQEDGLKEKLQFIEDSGRFDLLDDLEVQNLDSHGASAFLVRKKRKKYKINKWWKNRLQCKSLIEFLESMKSFGMCCRQV